jgi:hypothetical protein
MKHVVIVAPPFRFVSGSGTTSMRVSEWLAWQTLCSLVIEIFLWHVVLREFSRRNFRYIRVGRALDTANDTRLEGLSFFEKFFDAFRIRLGAI